MREYKLTTGRVGRTINLSPGAVVRLILKGDLPAIKVGRKFRISEEDLSDFLARARVVPTSGVSPELQDAIDQQQYESDDRYCEQSGT
jgi:excisionase family DNA binding protein